MTTIDTGAAPRIPALPVAPRALRLLSWLSDALAARALRRETYRSLERLSDRDLADIGLTRAAVEQMR